MLFDLFAALTLPLRAARAAAVLGVLLMVGGLSAAGAAAKPTATEPRLTQQTQGVLSQYRLDGWQAEQGLPIGIVQTLHQTRDGVLWLGTGGGLARFDGLRFTLLNPPELEALGRRPIFGFLEDRQGRLWIGHGGGAARWDGTRFVSMLDAQLINNRRVWAFAEASDGSVWAASEGGLVHWPTSGTVRVYREADGLPTDKLRSLAFDTTGTLWIGTTGGGLVAFRSERFETFGAAQGFPHPEVRFVLPDPKDGVWAATAGAGLVHWGAQGLRRHYTVADGLATDQLTALARDSQGAMWIATWGAGLLRWQDGRFEALSTAQGLGGDQLWAVHADREGSLWVGSWNGGLNRLQPRRFAVLGQPEGLPADHTRSVLRARDGALWVSTAGGGVSRLDGQRVQTWSRATGLPTNEVSALYEDRDGALWWGTYTDGLLRYHEGRVQHFSSAQGLPHTDVRAILRDRAGTLWVGLRGGLARWREGRFERVDDEGAPKEGVVALLEDRQGVVWMGTTGDGLLRWQDGRFTRLTRAEGLASNWILALHEDARGSLWVGTNGEGLHRLREGKVATILPKQGLWDGLAQTFQEDRHGRLWMTSNRGLFWATLAELDAVADGRASQLKTVGYGVGDGLRSPTFAGGLQPVGAVDAQGLVWLPSLRGLVRVDPGQLPALDAPPPVRLEDVLQGGQSLPWRQGLELAPGQDAPLTLRWAVATVRHADRVRLRYRLQGLSDDWIEVQGQRETTIPTLPHGDYVFTLASSLDGSQWVEGEPLFLTIQPHLWQTRWAQSLAVLLGVLGVLGFVRGRTHALQRRQAEMQRLVDERTEELRLANEHLSRLSYDDALTGLPNRRRFDEQFALEWRRLAREGTPLALILADVDHFKAYNDTLGHAEGDLALREVAEIFRRHTGRAGDFAARYGGEEFVVLLPGFNAEAAALYAERLRVACEAHGWPHPSSPTSRVLTLTLGVACLVPGLNETPEQLFAQADAALYRAKAEGRNRIRTAFPLEAPTP